MQSIIGKIFFAASLGSQSEQQNLMDLDDSEDKDGLRGHKTVWATTLLAQIASVVFLCCLTICSQENTKCCSLCAKVLQDFLCRFTKISKRAKKEAEKNPEKLQNFSLQITSVVKNVTVDFILEKYHPAL